MGIVSLIWLIILLSSMQPLIRQRVLLARRVAAINRLEGGEGAGSSP